VATPAPLRVAYRDAVYYRRIWKENIVGAYVQPLLYLLGVGVGVGSLVDDGPASADLLGGVSYFAFYATALLATTAMFNASQEALWPTADGFSWSYVFWGMVATPIEPRDLATSRAIYFGGRTAVGAVGVATVLALFDGTRSLGLVAAIPVAVLCGLAFSMPIAAWTATRTSDKSYPSIIRFIVIPMFLFGGAFYPIEQLPDALEPVAWATPLWHAIELCRGLVLGGLGVGRGLVHLAVLLAYAIAGWAACTVTFRRRLYP
jgi:lipooligosaccharide transport system permease protein